eukprot:gnl/Dysnectes_brevis/2621_a3167_847.p1 GENE.gnl/Dysnectes_brevis/2621_a3167_847~~gnl/Dysnectes_brevis/2621_a3167_847.p1  ORF type:complete len:2212 (+),score=320.76 gnl/Dysnectes_brevis/2621_a3167_847:129-6764(+)
MSTTSVSDLIERINIALITRAQKLQFPGYKEISFKGTSKNEFKSMLPEEITSLLSIFQEILISSTTTNIKSINEVRRLFKLPTCFDGDSHFEAHLSTISVQPTDPEEQLRSSQTTDYFLLETVHSLLLQAKQSTNLAKVDRKLLEPLLKRLQHFYPTAIRNLAAQALSVFSGDSAILTTLSSHFADQMVAASRRSGAHRSFVTQMEATRLLQLGFATKAQAQASLGFFDGMRTLMSKVDRGVLRHAITNTLSNQLTRLLDSRSQTTVERCGSITLLGRTETAIQFWNFFDYCFETVSKWSRKTKHQIFCWSLLAQMSRLATAEFCKSGKPAEFMLSLVTAFQSSDLQVRTASLSMLRDYFSAVGREVVKVGVDNFSQLFKSLWSATVQRRHPFNPRLTSEEEGYILECVLATAELDFADVLRFTRPFLSGPSPDRPHIHSTLRHIPLAALGSMLQHFRRGREDLFPEISPASVIVGQDRILRADQVIKFAARVYPTIRSSLDIRGQDDTDLAMAGLSCLPYAAPKDGSDRAELLLAVSRLTADWGSSQPSPLAKRAEQVLVGFMTEHPDFSLIPLANIAAQRIRHVFIAPLSHPQALSAVEAAGELLDCYCSTMEARGAHMGPNSSINPKEYVLRRHVLEAVLLSVATQAEPETEAAALKVLRSLAASPLSEQGGSLPPLSLALDLDPDADTIIEPSFDHYLEAIKGPEAASTRAPLRAVLWSVVAPSLALRSWWCTRSQPKLGFSRFNPANDQLPAAAHACALVRELRALVVCCPREGLESWETAGISPNPRPFYRSAFALMHHPDARNIVRRELVSLSTDCHPDVALELIRFSVDVVRYGLDYSLSACPDLLMTASKNNSVPIKISNKPRSSCSDSSALEQAMDSPLLLSLTARFLEHDLQNYDPAICSRPFALLAAVELHHWMKIQDSDDATLSVELVASLLRLIQHCSTVISRDEGRASKKSDPQDLTLETITKHIQQPSGCSRAVRILLNRNGWALDAIGLLERLHHSIGSLPRARELDTLVLEALDALIAADSGDNATLGAERVVALCLSLLDHGTHTVPGVSRVLAALLLLASDKDAPRIATMYVSLSLPWGDGSLNEHVTSLPWGGDVHITLAQAISGSAADIEAKTKTVVNDDGQEEAGDGAEGSDDSDSSSSSTSSDDSKADDSTKAVPKPALSRETMLLIRSHAFMDALISVAADMPDIFIEEALNDDDVMTVKPIPRQNTLGMLIAGLLSQLQARHPSIRQRAHDCFTALLQSPPDLLTPLMPTLPQLPIQSSGLDVAVPAAANFTSALGQACPSIALPVSRGLATLWAQLPPHIASASLSLTSWLVGVYRPLITVSGHKVPTVTSVTGYKCDADESESDMLLSTLILISHYCLSMPAPPPLKHKVTFTTGTAEPLMTLWKMVAAPGRGKLVSADRISLRLAVLLSNTVMMVSDDMRSIALDLSALILEWTTPSVVNQHHSGSKSSSHHHHHRPKVLDYLLEQLRPTQPFTTVDAALPRTAFRLASTAELSSFRLLAGLSQTHGPVLLDNIAVLLMNGLVLSRQHLPSLLSGVLQGIGRNKASASRDSISGFISEHQSLGKTATCSSTPDSSLSTAVSKSKLLDTDEFIHREHLAAPNASQSFAQYVALDPLRVDEQQAASSIWQKSPSPSNPPLGIIEDDRTLLGPLLPLLAVGRPDSAGELAGTALCWAVAAGFLPSDRVSRKLSLSARNALGAPGDKNDPTDALQRSVSVRLQCLSIFRSVLTAFPGTLPVPPASRTTPPHHWSTLMTASLLVSSFSAMVSLRDRPDVAKQHLACVQLCADSLFTDTEATCFEFSAILAGSDGASGMSSVDELKGHLQFVARFALCLLMGSQASLKVLGMGLIKELYGGLPEDSIGEIVDHLLELQLSQVPGEILSTACADCVWISQTSTPDDVGVASLWAESCSRAGKKAPFVVAAYIATMAVSALAGDDGGMPFYQACDLAANVANECLEHYPGLVGVANVFDSYAATHQPSLPKHDIQIFVSPIAACFRQAFNFGFAAEQDANGARALLGLLASLALSNRLFSMHAVRLLDAVIPELTPASTTPDMPQHSLRPPKRVTRACAVLASTSGSNSSFARRLVSTLSRLGEAVPLSAETVRKAARWETQSTFCLELLRGQPLGSLESACARLPGITEDVHLLERFFRHVVRTDEAIHAMDLESLGMEASKTKDPGTK